MGGSFIHQDFTKEVKRLYKIVNMKQGNNQGSFQIEFVAWKLLNLSEITVIKNFFNQIQPEVEEFHHWLNKVHEDTNTIMHKSNETRMQGTMNKNAASIYRICWRSDHPKLKSTISSKG